MPSLAMGVGLDKHSGPKLTLIEEYVSDFTADADGWNTYNIDADITFNQTIDGVDGALFVSPAATVTGSTQFGYIYRVQDSDFNTYDEKPYQWEFSLRYYRAGGVNPFQVLLRMGALGSTQNNAVVFTSGSGVTDAWTDVSLSGTFLTTTGNNLMLYINSLPASATGIYFKDITLRVFG